MELYDSIIKNTMDLLSDSTPTNLSVSKDNA